MPNDTVDALLENTHPGQMLRVDFLQPLGITPGTLAGSLGLSQTHISKVLHGQRKITPLTSLLLGKFFGMSPQFWLNLQSHHDIIKAQRKASKRLERVVPFLASGTREILGAGVSVRLTF